MDPGLRMFLDLLDVFARGAVPQLPVECRNLELEPEGGNSAR
jgi:hypothetical protein